MRSGKKIIKQVRERELTDKELKRREEIADDLPDAEFKKRYGAAWKGIKMATATNMAKKEEVVKEETVFVVRFEKEGMRFATPFYDKKNALEGAKILRKASGVKDISITKDILKPGIKFSRKQEGKIVAESKMGALFLDMQTDAQEMSLNDFIKKYRGQMGMSPDELKRMHKEFNEENKVEETEKDIYVEATSLAIAAAARALGEKPIDPADFDDFATDDDRKAADKNIIIQLRRAQDMGGKADVTFLDNPRKKMKVDIRIINKALEMFDKMRPNDKARMQSTISKSYKGLLDTVKRGRV